MQDMGDGCAKSTEAASQQGCDDEPDAKRVRRDVAVGKTLTGRKTKPHTPHMCEHVDEKGVRCARLSRSVKGEPYRCQTHGGRIKLCRHVSPSGANCRKVISRWVPKNDVHADQVKRRTFAPYCRAHGGSAPTVIQGICSNVDRYGEACTAIGTQVRGFDAPRCAAHRHRKKRCLHCEPDGTRCVKYSNASLGSTQHCNAHGGGPRCAYVHSDGTMCTAVSFRSNENLSGMCKEHGGGVFCQFRGADGNGCSSVAMAPRGGGPARLCVRHGGGVRCIATQPDGTPCTKSAVRSQGNVTMHCIFHGGGDRCTCILQDGSRCTTTAAITKGVGRLFCSRHGGGPRCQFLSADGEPCTSGAVVCKGQSMSLCRSHGGGLRCESADHDFPPTAMEPYPRPVAHYERDGVRMCWQHYYSGINRCRAIRRELLLLGSLLCGVPRGIELQDCFLGHDFTLSSCHLMRRPDMLFRFNSVGLLVECDENAHRDRKLITEELHLAVIRQWMQEKHDLSRLYVVRINPDGDRPMFVRRCAGNAEMVWEPTEHCEEKLLALFSALKPVVDAGLDDDMEWIDRTFAETPSNEPLVVSFLFF